MAQYSTLSQEQKYELLKNAIDDGELSATTNQDSQINNHYGGEKETTQYNSGAGSWSWGCQILRGKDTLRNFMALVEADTTVKREELKPGKHTDNEGANVILKPGNDILYTLIAAFTMTETGGLPRPQYEHHYLYNYFSGSQRGGVVKAGKLINTRECRFLSTSFGMGQLVGANYAVTPLATCAADLFYLTEGDQFKVIVDFLRVKKSTCSVVLRDDVASAADVEACVETYNGAAYKTNDYHNILFRNFKEAKAKW